MLQGTYSYVLQDEDGQIALTHSVSAGLDYASIGPEHAALHDSGRAEYVSCDDAAALDAVVKLARTEGILPALESAHAVAEAIRIAPALSANEILVVNLSGRGDKDMGILGARVEIVGSSLSSPTQPQMTQLWMRHAVGMTQVSKATPGAKAQINCAWLCGTAQAVPFQNLLIEWTLSEI